MKVVGNYAEDGYALLQGLIPKEVAQAFLQGLKQDIGPGAIPLSRVTDHVNLLNRPAFEVYGHHYKPMLYFLWGLTPVMSGLGLLFLLGLLLPAYTVTARVLHWLTAALILVQIPLGVIITNVEMGTWADTLYNLH